MTIMNTMKRIFLPSFIASLIVGVIIADPSVKVTFNKIDVKIIDNPYFGQWESEIHPPGETISYKVPIKKDVPETMMIRAVGLYAGSEIGGIDMPICEAFDDQTIGKGIVDAGTPKGKFPRKCPIKAADDYVISKYMVPLDIIPPGIPDGAAAAEVEFYEPGKDPYITIRVEGGLSHKIPGLGR